MSVKTVQDFSFRFQPIVSFVLAPSEELILEKLTLEDPEKALFFSFYSPISFIVEYLPTITLYV